jgi:hypothetical protein
MSDQVEQIEDFVDDEDLQEFKSSMGDPSMVPEPAATKSTKRGPDKSNSEKSMPKQGSSDDEKAKEVPMPSTKMGMINAMVQKMNGMKKAEMSGMYNDIMSAMNGGMKKPMNMGDEPEVSPSAVKIDSGDIDVKDDIAELFKGDELSEEFKEKAAVVFEAAVVAKINEQLEKVTVDVEEEIKEAKEHIEKDLSEKLDSYLDYVVENWMEENKVAIEKGLQTEIASDFMEGLKDLFKEHYIDIPEERVDVAEELAMKSDELEDNLNQQIEKNVELKKELDNYKKAEIVSESADGLTETQAEKLSTLAEGIEFESVDTYKQKVQVIKENYFPAEVVSENNSSDDEEPIELEEETTKIVEPAMANYVSAISRTAGSSRKTQ